MSRYCNLYYLICILIGCFCLRINVIVQSITIYVGRLYFVTISFKVYLIMRNGMRYTMANDAKLYNIRIYLFKIAFIEMYFVLSFTSIDHLHEHKSNYY